MPGVRSLGLFDHPVVTFINKLDDPFIFVLYTSTNLKTTQLEHLINNLESLPPDLRRVLAKFLTFLHQ